MQTRRLVLAVFRRPLVVLMLVLSTWTLAARVHAQAASGAPPSANQIALARQQFEYGVEAARRGSWEDALVSFERSHALFPHPQTLFNVAGARRQLGKLVASAEAYRAFLRVPPQLTDAESRAKASMALEQIAPHVAVVAIHIHGLSSADYVQLDEGELSLSALDVDLPIDPGEHTLRLTRRGRELLRHDFTATGGVRTVLELAVEAAIPPPEDVARGSLRDSPLVAQTRGAPAAGHIDEAPRVWKRWWFWTVIGGVVAGSAVTTAVVMLRDDERPGFDGSLGSAELE